MLHLPNLEQIEAFLLEIPALVNRLDERDPAFLSEFKSWLARVEEVLANNRIPATSEIAVCRGLLIALERGDAEDPAERERMGARKYREARASHLLRRATGVISDAVRNRRTQVDEAGSVMMQVVAAGERLGLLPPEATSGTWTDGDGVTWDALGPVHNRAPVAPNHTAYLQGVLKVLENRAELTSLVVHVTGLLGETDTLIVLDRSIAGIKQ